jgi:hypothetical protein
VKGVLQFNGKQTGILFLLFLNFSCQQTEQKPDDVLSHNEMVKVLAEVYITEEKISRAGISPDSAALLFEIASEKLYDQTGVPDSVFKESLNYYMDRPKEMEMIYSILIDSLQLREQRMPFQTSPQ